MVRKVAKRAKGTAEYITRLADVPNVPTPLAQIDPAIMVEVQGRFRGSAAEEANDEMLLQFAGLLGDLDSDHITAQYNGDWIKFATLDGEEIVTFPLNSEN